MEKKGFKDFSFKLFIGTLAALMMVVGSLPQISPTVLSAVNEIGIVTEVSSSDVEPFCQLGPEGWFNFAGAELFPTPTAANYTRIPNRVLLTPQSGGVQNGRRHVRLPNNQIGWVRTNQMSWLGPCW